MIKAAVYACGDLLNPELYDRVYKLISPQRREHVDAAKNLKNRCQRLGASHLLEKLLWENHIERPYVFSETEQGKPIMLEPEGIYFSLSHSDLFAAAVISDRPCGIDIERIREYKPALVKRFFTRYDQEYLAQEQEEYKNRAFTEMWTFKEATCKMLDRPLVQVLQWIDFSPYSDCSKGDISWNRCGYEFRDFYITICQQTDVVKVPVKLFSPAEGRYY